MKRSLEGAVPARFSISSVEVAASLQERVFLALAEEAAPPALHCTATKERGCRCSPYSSALSSVTFLVAATLNPLRLLRALAERLQTACTVHKELSLAPRHNVPAGAAFQ